MEQTKTSSEWQLQSNYKVFDPDGWDRKNFQYSWNEELITKEQFNKRLCWTDGPCLSDVENVTKKYEFGTFNGMNDLYEYDNADADFPQCKYVFTEREISEKINNKVQLEIIERYGNIFLNSDSDFVSKFDKTKSQFVRSYIYREKK